MGVPSLDQVFSSKKNRFNQPDLMRYVFFKHGIGEEGFNSCSLPYIFRMVEVYGFFKEEERKQMKKSKRGKSKGVM